LDDDGNERAASFAAEKAAKPHMPGVARTAPAATNA